MLRQIKILLFLGMVLDKSKQLACVPCIVHHIIYLSQSTVPFSDAALQDLVLRARDRNARHEVTGLLLYGNEQFVLVLEGDEATVWTLYDLIKHDPRHRDVIAYADKPIEQRAFATWAMAFHAPSLPELTKMAGYLPPNEAAIDPTRLQQADAQLLELLRSFVLTP